jgi:hypothetical protein
VSARWLGPVVPHLRFCTCENPRCGRLYPDRGYVTQKYCEPQCARRRRYDKRHADQPKLCTHCNEPRVPGGVTCAYHRLRVRLRVRVVTLRKRKHQTPALRARIAALDQEYHRLGAEHRRRRRGAAAARRSS